MIRIPLALLLIQASLHVFSQEDEYPFPPLSPKGSISQIVGNTTIKVAYERPAVRGRQIFGELVPWGKIWRTGAGYATKISFDKEVIVGGQKVQSGNYSIFTIPGTDEWLVILNSDTSLYGTYDYDEADDAARFTVIPERSNRFYETLTIDLDIIPNNARLYLSWANTQIHFDILTSTDAEIRELIEKELLTYKHQKSDLYAGAADYLLYRGENYKDALQFTDYAIKLDADNEWARSLKAEIYERMKLYGQAIAALKEYQSFAQSKQYSSNTDKDNTLAEIQRELTRLETDQK